jgi:hypothetical protein
MNISTFFKQLQQFVQGFLEWIEGCKTYIRVTTNKVMRFLDGDNALQIQFIAFEGKASFEKTADSVSIIVPQLGIIFDGTPEVSLCSA